MSFPLKELTEILSKPTVTFGSVVSVSPSYVGIATKSGLIMMSKSSAQYPVAKGDQVVIRNGTIRLTRTVGTVIPL
jgi:hypothetical protein